MPPFDFSLLFIGGFYASGEHYGAFMTTFVLPLVNGTYTYTADDTVSANHLLAFQYTNQPSAGTISVNCRAPGAPIGAYLPVSGGLNMPMTQNNLLDFKFPISEIQFILAGITGGSGTITATLSNW